MPAYTSLANTGDFFSGANWVGGAAPDPNGIDTTTLANGATLTIAAGTTANLGDPANPTVQAVRTAGTGGTGVLIVNGTLRVASNILQGNATWQVVGAGAVVESKNTTSALTWTVSDANSQDNARLTVTGTGIGANRAIIRNGTGAAGFSITRIGNRATLNTSFARFFDLGTSSVSGIVTNANNGTVSISITDTVFENCGQIGSSQDIGTTNGITLQRVLVTGAKATLAMNWAISVANPTGARVFEDVHISTGSVQIAFPSSGTWFPTFTRCIFGGSMSRTGTMKGNYVDCLFRSHAAVNLRGDITRGFYVTNQPTSNNWHGPNMEAVGQTTTVDGLVFDGVVDPATGNGDLLFISSTNAATQINVRNVLCTVANTSSGSYGKMTSQIAGTSGLVAIGVIENNTWITGGSGEGGMLGTGETIAGFTGMLGTVRNNLAWGRSSGLGVLISRQAAGAAANTRDVVVPANCTNNGIVNAYVDAVNGNGNATNAGGDGIMWSASGPTHTFVGNPSMVDDTRNLATWYRSVVGGTPGTRTDDMTLALNALLSANGDSPVTGATITAAHTWIRAGFRPTNTAIRTNVSANNGGWLGAMEGVSSKFLPHLYCN